MDHLPDLLAGADGKRIEGKAEWESRREELLRLFARHIYGVTPPAHSVAFETREEQAVESLNALRRRVTVHYTGPGGAGSFSFHLYRPWEAERPPVTLLGYHRRLLELDVEREFDNPFWPVRRMLNRGYAAAIVCLDDLSDDGDESLQNGVHLVLDGERTGESWGAVSAWGWGLSRIMDYLVADPAVDGRRVTVAGHSRGGKAVLWCAARDRRFHLVVSNVSGCTGAAVARMPGGETVADINRAFPHWFCGNYKNYSNREEALPVDQHMLLALAAPQHLYVTSASADEWANPPAEFAACALADPAYSLYFPDAFPFREMPPENTPLWGSRIGYHLRRGEHGLCLYDWERILDFAGRETDGARPDIQPA